MCKTGNRDYDLEIWGDGNHLTVLGYSVYSDAGNRKDWLNSKPALWGTFWQNAGSSSIRSSSSDLKIGLLSRTVLARILWKMSAWVYQKSIAVELDALQTRMMVIILKIRKLPDESFETWLRRRNRIASRKCCEIGRWSIIWANRFLNWHKHVMRSNLFSRKLIEYRDAQWLIAQRMRFVSRNRSATSRNRPHAGRTGTRGGLGGKPQPRWQEGVALAKQVLNVSADDSEYKSF